MTIVNCEAYTCYNNAEGICQLNSIKLIDKEYFDEQGQPNGDDMCCDNYLYYKLWERDNPVPAELKAKWREYNASKMADMPGR